MKKRYELNLAKVMALFILGVITAVFMITEAGEYYNSLYKKDLDFGFAVFGVGYLVAFLIEAFLAIMPIARFNTIETSRVKARIFDGFRWFLIIMLFTVAVGGASLRLVRPRLAEISAIGFNSKIIELLEKQQTISKGAIETFKDQKQRTNTALAFKEFSKASGVLRSTLIEMKRKTVPDTIGSIVDIVIVVWIRVVLQIANIVCFWMVGYVFRSGSTLGIRSDIFRMILKSKYSLNEILLIANCSKEALIKGIHEGYGIGRKQRSQIAELRERVKRAL